MSEDYKAQVEKLRGMMDHSFGGPGFVVYGTKQSIAEVERRLAPDAVFSNEAELLTLLNRFCLLYGRLWDCTNGDGEKGGFIFQKGVDEYDALHIDASRLLARINGDLIEEDEE